MRDWRCAAFAWLLLVVASEAQAQSPEYRLKAAFLLNFARFAAWPEPEFSSSRQITLCVAGDDKFGTELDALEGKKVQGREFVIRRNVGRQELRTCHIVFVGSNPQPILDTVASMPVLTVGEQSEFCSNGGILTFVANGSRVQFEVNLDAAERSGIKLNPQMLHLAKTVYRKGS